MIAMLGCALAGCFSDRGVALEIEVGDTRATTVELYLGQRRCDPEQDGPRIDCSRIAPPDGRRSLAGDVWFRDDLVPFTAAVRGGVATFQLRASELAAGADDSSDEVLPIVVAVGMIPGEPGPRTVGATVLRDLAIPRGRGRVVTAALAAAGAVATGPGPDPAPAPADDEHRVQVWTKQTPASSCVVVEQWQRGDVTRDFVVPAEDPDCDDVARECNPNAYHGESAAGMAVEPDCFAPAGPAVCLLGSRGCTDDTGPSTGTCAVQRNVTCVPAAFCACSALDDGCTAGVLDAPNSQIPRIECRVPARLMPRGIELCAGTDRAMIDLERPFDGGRCEEPLLSSLALDGFATSHDFGGAIMELGSPQQDCRIPLTWKTGVRTPASSTDDHGVLQLRQRDSATALLLPIVLHFDLGLCGPADTFSCELAGDNNDPVWSCAN